MTMHRRFTTLTSILLLVPFLLFVVLLKGSNKNSFGITENEIRNENSISSGSNVYQMTQLSGTSCKCNCDRSDKSGPTLESTTDQSNNQKEADIENEINIKNLGSNTNSKSKNPIIFVITPTYSRPTQMADMTRLSQTLRLVKDLFWIVVEDSHNKSMQVSALLNRSTIPYAHLLGPRPVTHLDRRSGRGVSNRLKALEYLRESYTNTSQEGVIYFADDDNAYDIRIFEEIRDTKKVSMFPVGLIAKLGLSTPIVNNETAKIIGFHDPFISRRKYAVDMAGFAVNLQLFLSKPKATMPYKVGYEEDYFIKSLGVQFKDLEPKANNCTEILVWHTKTNSANSPTYAFMMKEKGYNETNLPLLYDNVINDKSNF